MQRAVISIAGALWLAAMGARAQAPAALATPTVTAELERAREAAAALTTELRARLTRELAAGGPVAAVRVCSEAAQQIAAEHSRPGLRVRRVSERWRNPADTPDAWEKEQLRRLAAAHATGELPAEVFQVVSSGAWRVLRYLKPIVIGGPCLSCHGDPAGIDPAVAALLRERYPEDKAVGYREGELRGAVSVVVGLP